MRYRFHRLSILSLLVIGAALPAHGQQPKGPLIIQFNPTGGQVAKVAVGGASVSDPKLVGGFSYRRGSSGPFKPLVGSVADGVLQAADGDLSLRATIASDPQLTRIDGRLTSSGQNVDLGLQLRFRLPIKAAGWTFWEDLRRSKPIDKPTRYAFEGPVYYQKPPRIAYYPLIALSPPRLASGVCMAVPLNSPNVYRLAYEESEGLYVDFDLGMHSAQHGGPHADFSLVVYPFQASWGMRAAMQGYYDRFPDCFVCRVAPKHAGTWFCVFDKKTKNPEDFGLAFDEHAYNRWAWCAKHRIYSMEYSEPWNYYDMWHPSGDPGPHPKPSYDEMIAHLKKGLESDKPMIRDGSKAALVSAIVMKDGKLRTDLRYWNGHYWHAIFRTILHPDLPGGMQDYMMNYEYLPALRNSQKEKAPLRGWYLDSTNISGRDPTYSTAHFALPGVRLSNDWEDGRAMLLGWMGSYQAIEQFSNHLHNDKKILFSNENQATLDLAEVHYVHLFDAMGIEDSLKRYLSSGEARPADYCDGGTLKMRALAYRKPLATLHYNRFKQDTFEFHWRHAAFYGIYDGPHHAWMNPQELEAYRPVAKRYVPLVRELNTAGWCPITYARSAGLWLERFGGEADGPLYITVRNPKTATTNSRIELDLSKAGLNGSVEATAAEMISGKSVPVNLSGRTARLTAEVAGEDTQVFRFSFTVNRDAREESSQ